MLALVFAALLGFASPPRASVVSDTTDDRATVRVAPVLPLSALYSGTFGVGLGAGLEVENVGRAGSRVAATAFGAAYGYGADLAIRTGDPFHTPLYGVLRADVSRATRRRYYGVGPRTTEADRTLLDHTSATVEARVGGYPLGTTALVVQPSARLLFDRVDAPEPETQSTLSRLDDASREAAHALLGDTRVGVSLGLEAATDRLDWRPYPSRGTLAAAEARRHVALDGSGLGFTRGTVSVAGYQPVGSSVLFGRAVGVVTRQDGDDVLPFATLPTLDQEILLAYSADRFRGRDLLAVSGGVRVPVADVYGLLGLDVELSGALGAVYDDVFEQAELTVDFTSDRPTGAPLRPALSVGLNLVDRPKGTLRLGGRVGVSPEGVALSIAAPLADVRDLVPQFR